MKEDKPRIRPCLRCERPFLSEHIGNRLCKFCNGSDVTHGVGRPAMAKDHGRKGVTG